MAWPLGALILVIARLLEPASELCTELWYPETALAKVLGVPIERVDDNRLYRALDELLPHKEQLPIHLKPRLETYMKLTEAEAAFKIHKTVLSIRPHWRISRAATGVLFRQGRRRQPELQLSRAPPHCKRFKLQTFVLLLTCLVKSMSPRIALGIAFWIPLSLAAQADTESDDSVVQIVTLGDSITKGVRSGVEPEETFAALLEAGLKKQGIRAKVINAGIGGERTDGALARLEKEVIARRPQIVTIMYGTNDSFVDKGEKEPRLTAEAYRTNLKALVTKLRAAGAHPVLMTEPRWGPEARNGLDENPNGLLEEYMKECRSVAKEEKVPLVDHFAHWTKAEVAGKKIADWTTDQCHPNPTGHRVMAELIRPALSKLVEQK